MLKDFMKKIFIILFLMSLNSVFAKELSIPKIIKSSIMKQYKNKKISFISIKKLKTGKYLVKIKFNQEHDKVTIDKKGKIYSIVNDLSFSDNVGNGC